MSDVFLRIALNKGYLSREQINIVLEIQKQNENLSSEEICLEKKFLSLRHIETIREKLRLISPTKLDRQEKKREHSHRLNRRRQSGKASLQKAPPSQKNSSPQWQSTLDNILAKFIVYEGYLTLQQIHECFDEIKKQDADSKIGFGQFLVKKRLIDAQKFTEIYRNQQKLILLCPSCRQRLSLWQVAEFKTFDCPKCKHKLQEPAILKDICLETTAGSTGTPGLQPNTTFGKYLLLEEIARGGMGVVYKAKQKDVKRIVALKVMKHIDSFDRKKLARFQHEIATAGKLNHPNIVAIYDAGEINNTYYFTMEFIKGKTLLEVIEAKKISTNASLRIIEKIARAVHYAHQEKIIHRDLKPANIILDSKYEPHITDFGLAKDTTSDKRLTQTGQAIGTPFYMSPEQVEAKQVGSETDIYSLGVMLYQALTGKLPFSADSLVELYSKILTEVPPPLSKNRRYNSYLFRNNCRSSYGKRNPSKI